MTTSNTITYNGLEYRYFRTFAFPDARTASRVENAIHSDFGGTVGGKLVIAMPHPDRFGCYQLFVRNDKLGEVSIDKLVGYVTGYLRKQNENDYGR